jgi:N-acetylglucosamine-6-phosphate deacetylase
MKSLRLKNASAVLPAGVAENISILIENGKILEISEKDKTFNAQEIIDCSNLELIAGFIDIHNHGAAGVDVNSAGAEDLHKVSRFLAGKGVTAWVPTLVPDSDENYRKMIGAIDEVMVSQNEREPAARILGVHYEGVFASEKMCGALRPQFFKTFQTGEAHLSLPKLKNPKAIHLTTLAPEIENGIELINELRKQNWIVSIGHTRADLKTLNSAFESGAKQITHLFNAMTGVHHREIGVAGWALINDKVCCEIIADGHHVAPEMLKFAFDCKTSANLMLVSDSISAAGLGDGEFEIWNEKISVVNGKTQNNRGSIAGSVITVMDAFRMFESLGISKSEISKMASLNPAKSLVIEKNYGSIEAGKEADLFAVDQEGKVKFTIVGGRMIANSNG